MKKVLLVFIFVGIKLTVFCQGINNLWLMGYASGFPLCGGIDWEFNINPVNISLVNRKMNFGATDASICDKNGNILFYTNGLWVANNLHDTMVNGSGLNPGPFSAFYAQYGLPYPQGALILPMPADSLKYYIFHKTLTIPSLLYPTELNYTVVDMSILR